MKCTTFAILPVIAVLSACGGSATDMTPISISAFDTRKAVLQDSLERSRAVPGIAPPDLGNASFSGPIQLVFIDPERQIVMGEVNLGFSFTGKQWGGTAGDFVNEMDDEIGGGLTFLGGSFGADGQGLSSVSGRLLGLDVGDVDVVAGAQVSLKGTPGTSGDFVFGAIFGRATLADGSSIAIEPSGFYLEPQ